MRKGFATAALTLGVVVITSIAAFASSLLINNRASTIKSKASSGQLKDCVFSTPQGDKYVFFNSKNGSLICRRDKILNTSDYSKWAWKIEGEKTCVNDGTSTNSEEGWCYYFDGDQKHSRVLKRDRSCDNGKCLKGSNSSSESNPTVTPSQGGSSSQLNKCIQKTKDNIEYLFFDRRSGSNNPELVCDNESIKKGPLNDAWRVTNKECKVNPDCGKTTSDWCYPIGESRKCLKRDPSCDNGSCLGGNGSSSGPANPPGNNGNNGNGGGKSSTTAIDNGCFSLKVEFDVHDYQGGKGFYAWVTFNSKTAGDVQLLGKGMYAAGYDNHLAGWNGFAGGTFTYGPDRTQGWAPGSYVPAVKLKKDGQVVNLSYTGYLRNCNPQSITINCELGVTESGQPYVKGKGCGCREGCGAEKPSAPTKSPSVPKSNFPASTVKTPTLTPTPHSKEGSKSPSVTNKPTLTLSETVTPNETLTLTPVPTEEVRNRSFSFSSICKVDDDEVNWGGISFSLYARNIKEGSDPKERGKGEIENVKIDCSRGGKFTIDERELRKAGVNPNSPFEFILRSQCKVGKNTQLELRSEEINIENLEENKRNNIEFNVSKTEIDTILHKFLGMGRKSLNISTDLIDYSGNSSNPQKVKDDYIIIMCKDGDRGCDEDENVFKMNVGFNPKLSIISTKDISTGNISNERKFVDSVPDICKNTNDYMMEIVSSRVMEMKKANVLSNTEIESPLRLIKWKKKDGKEDIVFSVYERCKYIPSDEEGDIYFLCNENGFSNQVNSKIMVEAKCNYSGDDLYSAAPYYPSCESAYCSYKDKEGNWVNNLKGIGRVSRVLNPEPKIGKKEVKTGINGSCEEISSAYGSGISVTIVNYADEDIYLKGFQVVRKNKGLLGIDRFKKDSKFVLDSQSSIPIRGKTSKIFSYNYSEGGEYGVSVNFENGNSSNFSCEDGKFYHFFISSMELCINNKSEKGEKDCYTFKDIGMKTKSIGCGGNSTSFNFIIIINSTIIKDLRSYHPVSSIIN